MPEGVGIAAMEGLTENEPDLSYVIQNAVSEEIISAADDGITDIEVDTPKAISAEESFLPNRIFYEEYKRMTPLEKVQSCGFTRIRSYDAVEGVIKLKFMELEHVVAVNEFMEETEFLYKGMRELVVRAKVDEVQEAVEKSGLPFICWTHWLKKAQNSDKMVRK